MVKEAGTSSGSSQAKDPQRESDRIAGELPSKHDLQPGRRMFHILNGVSIALVYGFFLTHQVVVHIFGALAVFIYVFEQIRIKYPELQEKVPWVKHLLLRAEEKFKESSSVPYAMGVLLTLITFPKPIAIIAILILAVSDPLAAIIGIRFGYNKLANRKSVEGSATFFLSSFLIAGTVLTAVPGAYWASAFAAGAVIGFLCMLFEMIDLRLDDNLTIPLFSAFTAWVVCGAIGIPY